MQNIFPPLHSAELFQNIAETDLKPLLSCLSARTVRHAKGQVIWAAGDHVDCFGMVLSGLVQVVQDDFYGNRSILAQIGPGHLFGESYAFAEIEALPVSVLAAAECELIFIDYRRLAFPCAMACEYHGQLIKNLLHIVARKNIALTQKIEMTAKRTTREKLLAYLSLEAQKAGGRRFCIPFNRQELADYLAVDRSAMSAELSKLRREHILDCQKNQFELYDRAV
jgi:CRP/FNR family transcriptional regulator, dissimilatory nitrate respiration regulator